MRFCLRAFKLIWRRSATFISQSNENNSCMTIEWSKGRISQKFLNCSKQDDGDQLEKSCALFDAIYGRDSSALSYSLKEDTLKTSNCIGDLISHTSYLRLTSLAYKYMQGSSLVFVARNHDYTTRASLFLLTRSNLFCHVEQNASLECDRIHRKLLHVLKDIQ